MAFIIVESWKGRNRGSAGTHREYVMTHDGNGDSDENTAAYAFNDWLNPVSGNPGYINTPGINSDYEQISQDLKEVTGSSPVTFNATANWKFIESTIAGGKIVPVNPVNTDQITFTYNAQAPSAKIITSKETILQWSTRYAYVEQVGFNPFPEPPGEDDYAEFMGFINAERTDEGFKYNGLQLSPPPTTFEINWQVANSRFNEIQLDIMKWVGTKNETPFVLFGQTFAADELFFSSITGTKRTEADWEVNFGFSYARNRYDTSGAGGSDDRQPILGGYIRVPVAAHDYLWTFGLNNSWDVAAQKFQLPEKYSGIYVERVWDKKDWEETSLNYLQSLVMPY